MRKYKHNIVIFLFLLTFDFSIARQHYTQNTDFLLHESGVPGGSPSAPKRDYVAPQPTLSTKTADFPPLGPPSSSVTTPRSLSTPQASRPTQPSGKRDYVASNYPPLNPPANSQTTRNTDFPSLGPSNLKPTVATPQPSQRKQSNGKRDYVAPNYPSTRPTTKPPSQQGSGKVKDLIHFYEGKDNQPNTPPKVPSYSSILQGSTNGKTVTTPTPKVPTNQTPKPLSFSDIVAGSNRPTVVTTKPVTTRGYPTAKPGSNVNLVSTTRPVVLPSSIANGNQANGNTPTDNELQTLSEELIKRDANNAAKYITMNYQEKTTSYSSEDKAPLPLLTVSPEAWNIPTIQKIIPLLDNYERDTLVNEYVTPQERNEENAFLDEIMSTSIIRHLMTFLKNKGYVSPDPKPQRDFLKQIWFGIYSRGKGKLSSSGFEHIFVSELKNAQVSGLHNWIYFSREEQANRLNYLGYLKYADLGDKGAVVKFHINQQGVDKPVDSMFVGTSPELEMALYTLCFVTRVDTDCKLKLAGKDVNVATYKFRYRSKNYIGSGYPEI